MITAGGGKERAEEAADYGRDRARAAQDRLNRTADSYPSGGQIRREGRPALLPALLQPVICCARQLPFPVASCQKWVQSKFSHAPHPSRKSILFLLSSVMNVPYSGNDL